MPFFISARFYEKLQFHLLKFTNSENEISRRDLILKAYLSVRFQKEAGEVESMTFLKFVNIAWAGRGREAFPVATGPT